MLTFTGFTIDSDENKVYNQYFLDEAFLINCGPVLERLFDPDLKEEENDLQYLSYNEHLREIIKLVSTGQIDNKFLEMPRKQLRMIISFYSLNFYCAILDYPDEILKEYFYSQWYRTNIGNRKINKEFWTNNSRLIKIDSEKMKAIIQADEMRANCNNNCLSSERRAFVDAYYKQYILNCEKQFKNKTNKIFHKFKNNNTSVSDRLISFTDYSNRFLTIFVKQVNNYDASVKSLLKTKLINLMFDFVQYRKPSVDEILSILKVDKGTDIKEAIFDFIFDGTLIVAGGSIINLLNLDHGHNYRLNSDIDFFFINGNDENFEQRNLNKIKDIFRILEISRTSKNDFSYIRTTNSITYKNVQFILRAYNSIEQVLMGFDIAASSVGFDGKDFFMTPLAEISLRNRVIIPFLDQYSTSTTYRICKYAKYKNFSIYIPGVKADNLNQYLGKGFKGVPAIASWHYLGILPKSKSDYGYNINALKKSVLSNHKSTDHIKDYDKTLQKYFKGVIYSKTYEDVFMHYKNIKESFPIKWKTLNPGEQFTGSFEAMVYINPSLWYNPECKEGRISENYNEFIKLLKMIRSENIEELMDKLIERIPQVMPDLLYIEKRKALRDFLIHNNFTPYQKILLNMVFKGSSSRNYDTDLPDLLNTSKIRKITKMLDNVNG